MLNDKKDMVTLSPARYVAFQAKNDSEGLFDMLTQKRPPAHRATDTLKIPHMR